MSIATRTGSPPGSRSSIRREVGGVVDHQGDRASRAGVAEQVAQAPRSTRGVAHHDVVGDVVADQPEGLAQGVAEHALEAGAGEHAARAAPGSRSDFEATRIGVPAARRTEVGGVGVERVEVDDDQRGGRVVEPGHCARSSLRASSWRGGGTRCEVVASWWSSSDPVLLQDGLDLVHVLEVVLPDRASRWSSLATALVASLSEALAARLSTTLSARPAPRPRMTSQRAGTAPPRPRPGRRRVHTTGEKTRCTAQVVTSSTMLATSFRVPVSQAASGSRLQASPRRPAAEAAAAPGHPGQAPAQDRQHQGERRPRGAVEGGVGVQPHRRHGHVPSVGRPLERSHGALPARPRLRRRRRSSRPGPRGRAGGVRRGARVAEHWLRAARRPSRTPGCSCPWWPWRRTGRDRHGRGADAGAQRPHGAARLHRPWSR